MRKTEALGNEKIGKLLFNLSLPSTIGMMVIMFYHTADMFFVGRGVGTYGIAAIAIVFPIQMLISAFGQLFGVGGSSIISRCLGAKDLEKANRTLGNIIIVNFVFSTLFVILIYTFLEETLSLFGASITILPASVEYFSILILASPFLSFLMMINSIFRAEGNASTAMWVMLTSALLNILLDPLFIFVFKMGIHGAAIATVLSEIVAVFYVVYIYVRKKTIFSLKLSYLKIDIKIIKETFAIGASSFVRQGGYSATTAVMNNALHVQGGDLAIAAYGLLNPIVRFVFFPLIGLVQGSMPIFGYNYGAKNYSRVLKTLQVANLSSFIISIFVFAILFLFTEPLLSIFTTDHNLIEMTVRAMRFGIILLPFVGFQMIGSGYYQALGKAVPSFILIFSRQVFAPIIFVIILPLYFGLDGIWLSIPAADFISIMLTMVLIFPQFRILRNKINSSISSEDS